MTTLGKTLGLAQVFQKYNDSGIKTRSMSRNNLVNLLQAVRQSPNGPLPRAERESLKESFSSIENLNGRNPKGKNGGSAILRDMIWRVSEQQQDIARPHTGKVTMKEVNTLQASAKTLEKTLSKKLNHLLSQKGTSALHLGNNLKYSYKTEIGNLAGKVGELEAAVVKTREKFITSEVNQKKPNLDKAKTLEKLSTDITHYKEGLSKLETKMKGLVRYADMANKRHEQDLEEKFARRHEPKAQKHYLGDGYS